MITQYVAGKITDKQVVKPVLFDLNKPEDYTAFQKIITSSPNLVIDNEIEIQLIELIKINNPNQSLTSSKALRLAEKHFGQSDFMTYGKWVHYP